MPFGFRQRAQDARKPLLQVQHLRLCGRQRRLPLLQEAAHRRIALETDRDLVGVPRFAMRARPRQQLRARRPVGLVLGEPRIGRDASGIAASPAPAPCISAIASARLIATTGEPASANSAS